MTTATETPVLPDARPRAATGPYGSFSADGREYRITDYRTPRPWVNIIANPRFGLAVSQTGGGFTWIDNSQLAALTRWRQDLANDSSGKFLYVRDADDGRVWSLAPAPTWPDYDYYACHHGLGYTTIVTEFAGLRATWTLFVPAADTIELWRVELHNAGDRPRRFELSTMLEWNCGTSPASRREFQKLFLETDFDAKRGAIFATNHMWDVPNARYGHWNTIFPYVSGVACSLPVAAAQGDRAAFIGRGGEERAPQALREGRWTPKFGRHDDAIAAMRSVVELRPGQRAVATYGLAAAATRGETEDLLDRWIVPGLNSPAKLDDALEQVRLDWHKRLAAQRVETPEATLDYLVNDWVRYQAIAARLWARAGYYQQSGAFGFRDQLQDSQVWLTIEPRRCREQINLHARHQFTDGSVYHWWHPLTEQGHTTRMTDDLLWLAFVTAGYIKETHDLSILADETPYLEESAGKTPRAGHPLIDHVLRAFGRVFRRSSPRGLPYIGAGDWNDGLSACGLEEKGESVWLGQFLAGLLADWAEILRRAQRSGLKLPASGSAGPYSFSSVALDKIVAEFDSRRHALVQAINEHAWDGQWYLRGTLDDGSKLGSRENRVGRIFLNSQTWAILNDIAPPQRAEACLASMKEHLVTSAGALLLAPAFDTADERIGYITRYAPGMRENGGVYTHAATWAIAAAAKMKDAELVGRLLRAINPALKDPEAYWAEPYVLPGNVDGPASPYPGRGGWTWYTGSAQWLHRVVTQWVLGVRPEWDGLRIEPCLPPNWRRAAMVRPWLGDTYRIEIESGAKQKQVMLNGERVESGVLPPGRGDGTEYKVQVRGQ